MGSLEVYHNLSESYKLNQKTSNQLYREKKTKYRVDCFVADHTESIKMILREDEIEKVHTQ